jgi:hypothetical protein
MLNRERKCRRNRRTLCAEQLDPRQLLAVMAFSASPDSDVPVIFEREFSNAVLQDVIVADEVSGWEANTQNKMHGFEADSLRFHAANTITVFHVERADMQESLRDIEEYVDLSSTLLSLDTPNPLEQADEFKSPPEFAVRKWSDERLAGMALSAMTSVGQFSIPSFGKLAFDGSRLMAGWTLTQSTLGERTDAANGFEFFANRAEGTPGERTELPPIAGALVDMGSPHGSNLARIVSFLSQQLSFDNQSTASNVVRESSMASDSTSRKGADNSPTRTAPIDSAVDRIISSLGRRKLPPLQEDLEGGLLEIDSNAKSAARSRAVAAIMQDDTLPELIPVEVHWFDFVQALFFNRSSASQSSSGAVPEEPTQDKSTETGRTILNEDAEGGMIELAPTGPDVPMIASDESHLVRRNRHQQSVRMDAGVAFFQEFELSTSPALERQEIRIEEAGPREEPLKNTDVGQAKETIDLHSAAAIVPLVLIGLTMSNSQDEKQSPSATFGRRRRDRSLAG